MIDGISGYRAPFIGKKCKSKLLKKIYNSYKKMYSKGISFESQTVSGNNVHVIVVYRLRASFSQAMLESYLINAL